MLGGYEVKKLKKLRHSKKSHLVLMKILLFTLKMYLGKFP